MPCVATQGWQVMVERSDRLWSTGERNCKPLQYSYFENPMNSMKRQKGVTLKDAHPRSLGVQYTTGEEWRAITNISRMKRMSQRGNNTQLWMLSGREGKVQWNKEQYGLGTWNVRLINQGKLDVVKQEMARLSIEILEIRELKWMGMGEFNSDDHST